MQLVKEQKETIRRILSLTGQKQSALASYAEISPSIVSEALNFARDREVTEEVWDRLAAGLLKLILGTKRDRLPPDEQLNAELDRL